MYRHVKDISIKEDLIEEVARIYGYDEIPSSLPIFGEVTSGELKIVNIKLVQLKKRLKVLD